MSAESKERAISYGPEGSSRLYRWWRRTQQRAGNAILLWMAGRFQHTSERAGRRAGRALGWLLRYLSPRHYRIVIKNLRLAFGTEKSEEELHRIARACYRHMGKSLMEFIRLPGMSREYLLHITRVQGVEHIQAALERGKGVILLTAHLGNWELVGGRLALEGFPVNVIARAQRDTTLTDYISRTRESIGLRVYHRENSVKACLLALRNNEIVAMLLDQNAGDDGVFVDFFGHQASSAAGAAVFALRTDAAVLPAFAVRRPDDTHAMIVDPPVPLVRTDDQKQDIVTNTARYQKIIEEKVRAYPEQWFWLHKRWKSRPPEEREGGAVNGKE